MKTLALYYPEEHHKHSLLGHPERPERVEVIWKGISDLHLGDSTTILPPFRLQQELLSSVHTQNYLDSLEAACSQAQMLDLDTYTTRESWQLALNAAGGACAVAEAVWNRDCESGFALCRPPGHHATGNRGMGFCLINNVAVAAEYLLQKKGAERIAVIDLDLHHGNGTQDIFYERCDVSYLSIHQYPFYPGTGSLEETGQGQGKGYTLNLPIPGHSGDQAYLTLLPKIILPYLDRVDPQFVLVSFGFDTHWRDPLGSMLVSADCINTLFSDLKAWSDKQCLGKLAVILEGGYDLEAGKACGQAVVSALLGLEWEDTLGRSPHNEDNSWRETLQEARQIWDLKT